MVNTFTKTEIQTIANNMGMKVWEDFSYSTKTGKRINKFYTYEADALFAKCSNKEGNYILCNAFGTSSHFLY